MAVAAATAWASSLGVRDGRRIIDHSGEVNGFVSVDTLYPAEGVAIAVLTNAEGSTSAPSRQGM